MCSASESWLVIELLGDSTQLPSEIVFRLGDLDLRSQDLFVSDSRVIVAMLGRNLDDARLREGLRRERTNRVPQRKECRRPRCKYQLSFSHNLCHERVQSGGRQFVMADKTLLFARSRSIWLYASAFLAIATSGCGPDVGLNTGGVPTVLDIVVRSNSDDTKNHPTNVSFSISASCLPGQQLVGGGYSLININADPTLVAVEGNFPSPFAANTWTVQVRNPDNPSVYSGDADVDVMALAYCVTTPNFDLATEIVTQKTTIPHAANVTTDIDVRCAETSALVLSGGFLTSSLPVFTEPGGAVHQAFWPGFLGSGITGSGPRAADATHSSTGWHVTQQYTPALFLTAPQPDVSTSVFAICARKNVNNQAFRIAKASAVLAPTAATATTVPNVEVLCQQGEFTVGGGYDGFTFQFGQLGVTEIDGSVAVHSPFSFNGWKISGDSQSKPVDALALCVRIP